MPEPDAPAAPAADEPAAPANNEPLPGGLPADDPNGEGTTPEEVAATLRSSGMKVDTPPAAAAGDDEEGDDPDAAAAGAGDDDAAAGAGDDDAAAGDDDAAAGDDEDEPAAGADDGKPAPTAEEVKAAQDAKNAEITSKYAFEVTDANNVTFKITPDATMEDILAEFEPKNNGQILDILEKLREAKDSQKADQAEEAKQTQATERAQRASEIQKGWTAEAKDLQAQKRIPDGDDGDKRISDVYEFMATENTARMKAGRPTLNSFEDALDKLENKEARDKTVEDAKAEKETARKNGGLVGGSSAPAGNAAPVYKAGAARNANDALRSMGLLS